VVKENRLRVSGHTAGCTYKYANGLRLLEMPAVFYVTLRKVGNSLVLTLPKQIAEGNGWRKGETFVLSSEGEVVTIRKTRLAY